MERKVFDWGEEIDEIIEDISDNKGVDIEDDYLDEILEQRIK